MFQMLPDDAAAIARAVAGEEDGFREIVDRHSRAIYQLAYRITGRAEDAEDVVQDTFIKAFRQIGTFEARSSVATWLHRIGANCAIDLVRRRRPFEVAEAPETLDQRTVPGAWTSQAALVESAEIQRRIEETLTELSAKERAAFVMRHFQDSSIDDIASTLGMNTSAAKHAVFRAVRKMRAGLRMFVDGHTHD
jgi:RNA polymerase sigma-70 factor (ECF subfamily)